MIAISGYSGKCDIFDSLGDYTDEQLQQCNIFIEDNPVPLRINNQHDLAPYYPHLMISGGGYKGCWTCQITSRSFIDIEEEEHLSWKLRDFQKYWRKCKRDKTPYVESEAIEKVCWTPPTETDKEIANRVGMYGNKATIDGIHDGIHEYYRSKLLEEMINLGWDESRAKYWIWKDWKMLISGGKDRDDES